MTDGNLPNSEQYLITYLPDTGGMIAHRIKWEQTENKADKGHWQTYGRVPVDELPFGDALKIGQAVQKKIGPSVERCLEDGTTDGYYIHMCLGKILLRILLQKQEPTGIEYLKSLPVGTIYSYDNGKLLSSDIDHFVVVDGGICWFRRYADDHSRLWEWDGPDFKESTIAKDASPRTCVKRSSPQ